MRKSNGKWMFLCPKIKYTLLKNFSQLLNMNFSLITVFYATLVGISVFAQVKAQLNPLQPPPPELRPNRPFIPGGLSQDKDITPELSQSIYQFSPQIKNDITSAVLSQNPGRIPEIYLDNFRYAMGFLRVIPLSYKSQTVAGTNYYVRVGFGYQCYSVQMFQGLSSESSGSDIVYNGVSGPISCSSD